MSSFEPGFWIPSSVTFGAAFLDTGLNFYDSLVATLICTLFSGIHLCMCRRIMILHFRLAENKGRSHMQNTQTLVLMVLSIVFAALFIGSSFIYCVQFSRNIMLLRTTAPRTGVAASAGTILGCTGASFGEAGRKCVEVSISALQAGRRMELAFASMTQILIFLTDMLLVVRCYFVFKDKPQVYITAGVAFVASFAIWIFGLASLSKSGGLSASASWDWDLTGPSTALPKGYTSSMSIISSLIVNIIVTVSIVTRILRAQRRLQDNLSMSRVGGGQRDGVYLSASALLIESALPPVVFGILAAAFASTNIKEKRKAFEFELIPKMAWAAFTALAPQLLLVRILQGRAWKSAGTSYDSGVALSSTRFSRSTTVPPIVFQKRDNLGASDDMNSKRRPSLRSVVSSAGGDTLGGATEIKIERDVVYSDL